MEGGREREGWKDRAGREKEAKMRGRKEGRKLNREGRY